MRDWFTTEQQLVVHLLRCSLGYDGPQVHFHSELEQVDWDCFIRIASHHCVILLLFPYLCRDQEVRLPKAVMAAFEKVTIGQIALGLSHTQELKQIVHTLTAQHHRFFVHKGIALAAQIYPELQSRPCGSDFDIYIKRQDEGAVIQTLATLGYGIENKAYERINKKYTGEISLIKRTGTKTYTVDLHVEFAADAWARVTGFDMQDHWQKPAFVDVAGTRIPHLAVKPYLFFLAFHCANHQFDKLITFCDLDLFIRKYAEDIDWEDVVITAKKNRSSKLLFYALKYTQMYLQTPVPQDVFTKLKPAPYHVFLMPEKCLLLRDSPPPNSMKRRMHLLLLDRPIVLIKSVYHFTSRHVHQTVLKFTNE